MRIASLQTSVGGLTDYSDLEAVVSDCVRRDVDLLLTPEFAVGGLPHTMPGAVDRATSLKQLEDAWARSLPESLTVVLGFTEYTTAGLFSSAAVLRGGTALHVARKVFPREPGITPGTTSLPFELGNIPVGIIICADARHPELTASLANAGARILLCPLNNDMNTAHAVEWEQPTADALHGRALETRCYVVSADVAGSSPGRRALAATFAVSPDGDTIASTGNCPGELLVVDLTL